MQKLSCLNTNITKIPHIKGLLELNCSFTNITEIPDFYASKTSGLNEDDAPHIEGCNIKSRKCKWLNPPQDRLDKVIRLQKWFRILYKEQEEKFNSISMI